MALRLLSRLASGWREDAEFRRQAGCAWGPQTCVHASTGKGMRCQSVALSLVSAVSCAALWQRTIQGGCESIVRESMATTPTKLHGTGRAAAAGALGALPAWRLFKAGVASPPCELCSMLNKRLAGTDCTGYLGSAFLLSTVLIFKNWLGEGKPGAALGLLWAAPPWTRLSSGAVRRARLAPAPCCFCCCCRCPPHLQAWPWRGRCTCVSCWAWLG